MPSNEVFNGYARKLSQVLANAHWSGVDHLAHAMQRVWTEGRQVFFCGNGGSAGNAIHLANDFVYGVARSTGGGIRALSLSANPAVITCLANDVGYEKIYSEQLAVQGQTGDVLVVLSGSGNSPNILNAVAQAKHMGIASYAVLGYNGGKCKSLVDVAIHFPVDDMQIAEDMQLVVGHMLMQWLSEHRPQTHSQAQ